MRVRYTEPAAFELDASISYFREHAPSFVTDFADSIDNAVADLLDHPYSAQETEQRGVRRKYIQVHDKSQDGNRAWVDHPGSHSHLSRRGDRVGV